MKIRVSEKGNRISMSYAMHEFRVAFQTGQWSKYTLWWHKWPILNYFGIMIEGQRGDRSERRWWRGGEWKEGNLKDVGLDMGLENEREILAGKNIYIHILKIIIGKVLTCPKLKELVHVKLTKINDTCWVFEIGHGQESGWNGGAICTSTEPEAIVCSYLGIIIPSL